MLPAVYHFQNLMFTAHAEFVICLCYSEYDISSLCNEGGTLLKLCNTERASQLLSCSFFTEFGLLCSKMKYVWLLTLTDQQLFCMLYLENSNEEKGFV